MYCGNCGAKLPDNAAFCPKCGEAVETAAAEPMGSLVDRARAGDQGALQALYEQTYAQVYYTVKSMIKSEDDVFDILQDSYLKAFSHLDRFTSGAEFTPWIKTIAANTARDWLKKRRPMLFSELAGAEASDTPPEEYFADDRPEHLPEQVLDQKETVRLVREIIETLPEDQRAAIGMFYYEELSVRQIAAAMGVSESAVKSRLAYGRQKIEKKVRELEKKGTKLYGLSPIPFLLWLLRGLESREAVQPDSTVLGRILRDLPPAEAVPAGAGGTAIGAGHAAAIGAGKA